MLRNFQSLEIRWILSGLAVDSFPGLRLHRTRPNAPTIHNRALEGSGITKPVVDAIQSHSLVRKRGVSPEWHHVQNKMKRKEIVMIF